MMRDSPHFGRGLRDMRLTTPTHWRRPTQCSRWGLRIVRRPIGGCCWRLPTLLARHSAAKARAAAEKITGAVVVSSTAIDLLADIRKILEPKDTQPTEAISSAGLAVVLGGDPESQWSE